MIIRNAIANDIPGIVALLKISLGESLMPKSESFWNWKHNDNPFGPSPVLVALENDEIIGLRAFMRWEWRINDTIMKAVRAVDTATHPNHQGKGIFKKLTLAVVDECRSEGVHFIFNTPNAQSMPGYVKMGWMKLGKMRVQVSPVFPLGSSADFSCHLHEINNHVAETIINKCRTPFLMQTNYSSKYLQWRYGRNPNATYRALVLEGAYLIIFRIKTGRVREFRVTDFFCVPEAEREAASRLQNLARKAHSSVVTMATQSNPFFIHPSLKIGPQVTVRNLNLSNFQNDINFTHWRPSLGDLELF